MFALAGLWFAFISTFGIAIKTKCEGVDRLSLGINFVVFSINSLFLYSDLYGII
jgi:hypothetical protein